MGKGLDYVASARCPHDLVERVESGSGPDRALDYLIASKIKDTKWWDPEKGHHYTTSVDAVVDLVGLKLPGWEWCAGSSEAYVHQGGGHNIHGARNANPARALLSALLRALQALENSPASLADANQNQPDEAEHG